MADMFGIVTPKVEKLEARIIREALRNREKCVYRNGEMKSCETRVSNIRYLIYNDGRVYKYSWVRKNFDLLNKSKPVNEPYECVTIAGIYMRKHKFIYSMMHPASEFDIYMGDTCIVINHTVVSNVGGMFKPKGVKTEPYFEKASSCQYLEMCTQSDNSAHGKFIHKYGLYRVYVSAYDIREIEEKVEDLTPLASVIPEKYEETANKNRDLVVEYYKHKRPGFETDFR